MTCGEIRSLIAYLEGQRQGMIDLLTRLALAESPSDNHIAVNSALKLMRSELEGCGFLVRHLPGQHSGGVLFARVPLRRRDCARQLVIGHCDTVWPLGTVAHMPVLVNGDLLMGPGVFDMKGGLVQMIYSLRAINHLGLQPAAEVLVVINSDEEIGSVDSAALIRRLARCSARAFILEPAFSRAGKLKTARKACGEFTITIRGRAAHAGNNPEEGTSAILEMSYQIQKLFALNDASRGITVNVGTIDGGLRPNVIAPEVRAKVDVRVPTRADAAAIEAAIRNLSPVNSATSIEVEGSIHQFPMEPNARNQCLWRLAQDLGRQIGLNLEQASVGGASDGNIASQYTATLDGLGAVGDGAHAENEQIQISRMTERSALLTLLLLATPELHAETR
jgi:glutamate carboxypeptidase